MGVRRGAREVAAHEFEAGHLRLAKPTCAEMRDARHPRVSAFDEGARASEVAQRPQHKREVKHRRDARVLSEAEGQIVVAPTSCACPTERLSAPSCGSTAATSRPTITRCLSRPGLKVNQSWLVFERRLDFWGDVDDFEVRLGGRKVYSRSVRPFLEAAGMALSWRGLFVKTDAPDAFRLGARTHSVRLDTSWAMAALIRSLSPCDADAAQDRAKAI